MKWIGQHIYDQISRFRNDIYLEGISTSTETDMLVVDSNNKVSKRAIDAITVDVSDFMANGTNNYVVTATGADAMNAEANLQFNGTTLAVAGNETIAPGAEAEATALLITNAMPTQIALDIAASNTTADVINITADAVTTANVIDISCDALTTGSGLFIDDNSSATGVPAIRSVAKIRQNNTAAKNSTALEVISNGGSVGALIDKNASGTAAENAKGLWVDFDRTVPGSGTTAQNDIGIDLDVTSASLGTSSLMGMDIDVVGATSGTSEAWGMKMNVSGADTNYGLLISSSHYGLRVQDPTASSATQGGNIQLVSNDGAATGDDHRLGIIEFIGTDDTSSLVGAKIEAFADAAWSDTVNDGRLVFSTADGDDSLNTVLTLDSNKLATFTGAITASGAITGDLTGNASIGKGTRHYGSTIKILASDFMINDDASSPLAFKDGSNSGLHVTDTDNEAIAFIAIPEGMKATAVDIYSTHNRTVKVYEVDLNASFDFTATADESGAANTQITVDPNINATATNYLAITISLAATTQRVWGGLVTIAAQ